MKIDIRRYLALRDSLVSEKSHLENRLNEINQALGNGGNATTTNRVTSAPGAKLKTTRGRRKRGGGGGISLRDAVLQATGAGPLTKQQILERVQALGYRFSTKNPMNSLGVILYGKNPKFLNEGGRFSSAAASASQAKPAKVPGRRKRTMSPEARARIAAAQRARWAKTKGGK